MPVRPNHALAAMILGGTAAVALAPLAMAQAPSTGPKLVIEDAIGRFVIERARGNQVGVTIGQPGSGARDLPVVRAFVRDGVTYIASEEAVRRRSTNCRTSGASPAVRIDRGSWINLADLPLIRITAPENVVLVFSDSIGPLRAGALGEANVSLDACFDVEIGNVAGKLNGEIAGSGNFTAGNAGALDFGIAGSGTAVFGNIAGRTEVEIAGSGDVRIGAVNDATAVEIAGSGNVNILGGRASAFSVSIAGSGEVRFAGAAQAVSVEIAGAGDVDIASATGPIAVEKFGSGNVTIAGQPWRKQ